MSYITQYNEPPRSTRRPETCAGPLTVVPRHLSFHKHSGPVTEGYYVRHPWVCFLPGLTPSLVHSPHSEPGTYIFDELRLL